MRNSWFIFLTLLCAALPVSASQKNTWNPIANCVALIQMRLKREAAPALIQEYRTWLAERSQTLDPKDLAQEVERALQEIDNDMAEVDRTVSPIRYFARQRLRLESREQGTALMHAWLNHNGTPTKSRGPLHLAVVHSSKSRLGQFMAYVNSYQNFRTNFFHDFTHTDRDQLHTAYGGKSVYLSRAAVVGLHPTPREIHQISHRIIDGIRELNYPSPFDISLVAAPKKEISSEEIIALIDEAAAWMKYEPKRLDEVGKVIASVVKISQTLENELSLARDELLQHSILGDGNVLYTARRNVGGSFTFSFYDLHEEPLPIHVSVNRDGMVGHHKRTNGVMSPDFDFVIRRDYHWFNSFLTRTPQIGKVPLPGHRILDELLMGPLRLTMEMLTGRTEKLKRLQNLLISGDLIEFEHRLSLTQQDLRQLALSSVPLPQRVERIKGDPRARNFPNMRTLINFLEK